MCLILTQLLSIFIIIFSPQTDKKDLPVLLVGGGGILVDLQVPLKGTSNVTFPPNYHVSIIHNECVT